MSMSDVLETIEFKHGVVARIFADEDPQNPRENDNVGVMVCWHRRYNLGDKHGFKSPRDLWLRLAGADGDDERTTDDLQTAAEARGYVILPLYLFVHGGITMATSPFRCPWDSGQVGWIYAGPEEAKKIGVSVEDIRQCLESEVAEYDQFIKGDVYGVVIETPDGTADSCWGFFGYDYAKEEAARMASYYVKKYADETRMAGADI